jgi:molybdate transport system substrate-binding protein
MPISRSVLLKAAAAVCLLTAFVVTSARAQEIKFLCAVALRPAMDQLIAGFQKASNHSVVVSYANMGSITARIRKNEMADLSVTSPQQWERLRKEGKVMPDFRVQFAKIGIAFFVKKGTAPPNTDTVQAVKRALLNARTVVITDPARGSPSGVRALQLFERLGIASDLKEKTRLVAGFQQFVQALAKGDADIGINHASEIARTTELALAGPLPTEIQSYTLYVAGIPTAAKQANAAKALVKFFTTQAAAALFRATGVEPAVP